MQCCAAFSASSLKRRLRFWLPDSGDEAIDFRRRLLLARPLLPLPLFFFLSEGRSARPGSARLGSTWLPAFRWPGFAEQLSCGRNSFPRPRLARPSRSSAGIYKSLGRVQPNGITFKTAIHIQGGWGGGRWRQVAAGGGRWRQVQVG